MQIRLCLRSIEKPVDARRSLLTHRTIGSAGVAVENIQTQHLVCLPIKISLTSGVKSAYVGC